MENIIKENLWQALVSQQLHYITALATSFKHWGNMFIKTESILKYYSQETFRGNLSNVIQGHRGEKVASKYNFFGLPS